MRRTFRSKPGGFTLVEALVATSIAAIAGSALLLGIASAMQGTNLALEQTIGQGMAQQLMDELSGKLYSAAGAGAYQTPLGPNSGEQSLPGRQFDDTDDFNGVRTMPATDFYGKELGLDDGQGGLRHPALQAVGYFDRWRQEVDVYYVSETDQNTKLTGSQTSDYRAAEVRILYNDPVQGLRPVTTLRRVFANVPTP